MIAQQLLIKKYGLPGISYQSHYCITWNVQEEFPWFPAARFMVNKDFQVKLYKAFTNLERAGLQEEIKTFDGCYNNRPVRGYETISLHAWAAAIDLNAEIEKLGQATALTQWSGQFVSIMKAAGIYWGGDWNGRKDTMHFALLNG